MQGPMANGRGSHDQRAIGDRFSDGFELFGAREQRRCADGGTRLAKRGLVGIHDPQAAETEIAHRAGSRADIERVARGDEHDAQTVELSDGWQAPLF